MVVRSPRPGAPYRPWSIWSVWLYGARGVVRHTGHGRYGCMAPAAWCAIPSGPALLRAPPARRTRVAAAVTRRVVAAKRVTC